MRVLGACKDASYSFNRATNAWLIELVGMFVPARISSRSLSPVETSAHIPASTSRPSSLIPRQSKRRNSPSSPSPHSLSDESLHHSILCVMLWVGDVLNDDLSLQGRVHRHSTL
jgi:hypothetical protein